MQPLCEVGERQINATSKKMPPKGIERPARDPRVFHCDSGSLCHIYCSTGPCWLWHRVTTLSLLCPAADLSLIDAAKWHRRGPYAQLHGGVLEPQFHITALTTCEATCRYLLSSSGFTSSSGTVLPLCKRKTVREINIGLSRGTARPGCCSIFGTKRGRLPSYAPWSAP